MGLAGRGRASGVLLSGGDHARVSHGRGISARRFEECVARFLASARARRSLQVASDDGTPSYPPSSTWTRGSVAIGRVDCRCAGRRVIRPVKSDQLPSSDVHLLTRSVRGFDRRRRSRKMSQTMALGGALAAPSAAAAAATTRRTGAAAAAAAGKPPHQMQPQQRRTTAAAPGRTRTPGSRRRGRGLTPPAAAADAVSTASPSITSAPEGSREADVLDALRNVIDPDFGEDVVNCGFVKDLLVSAGGRAKHEVLP